MDYKYAMQLVAEELAEERYGKDFYDCTDQQQYELYTEAERTWMERQCDMADYYRKSEMEG